MANVNLTTGGYGLIPYSSSLDADNIVYCHVPASDSTALYVGSPVAKVGSANTAVINLGSNRVAGAHTFDIGLLHEVTHATAGDSNKIWGVVVGVMLDHNNYTAPDYRPASVEAVVKVVRMLPGKRFRILSNAALPAASVGLNANISASSGGSTTFGISSVLLDAAGTPAASSAKQLKIVAIGRNPSQLDVTSAGVEVIVEGNYGYDVVNDAGL
jgi:hypothetical protein